MLLPAGAYLISYGSTVTSTAQEQPELMLSIEGAVDTCTRRRGVSNATSSLSGHYLATLDKESKVGLYTNPHCTLTYDNNYLLIQKI